MIDRNGHACLADFGFLAVVSDPTDPTVSSSYAIGGTIRWMSPELLASDQPGLKNGQPMKQSDCYALGMVVYEVLSGRAPFAQFSHYIVVRKVMDGEHPRRPKGVGGAWFTDDLWRMVNRCWATRPENRPSIAAVLACLESTSKDLELSSLQVGEDLGTDGVDWNLTSDSSGQQLPWFDPRCFVALLREVLC